MHIHVGSNMPGFLPENAPFCFEDTDDAIQFLRSELRSLQDYYFDGCESDYDQENPTHCECVWCDTAWDIEAHISHIADGDGLWSLAKYNEVVYHVYGSKGPDLVFWARGADYDPDNCDEDW